MFRRIPINPNQLYRPAILISPNEAMGGDPADRTIGAVDAELRIVPSVGR
ncbi:MAG: hypothetical protein ABIQ30_11850 [Devosia sp.]